MSLQKQWTELIKIVNGNKGHVLKDIVNYIEDIKENPTTKQIEELEKKLNKVEGYLKKLDDNEFVALERLLKFQVNTIRNTANKQNDKKSTKWDMYVVESKKHKNWTPIHELIDFIEEKDTKNISEQDIEKIHERFVKEVMPFANKNLSPFNIDWTSKEFNKKLRIFKNRVSRVIEDDFGSWIRQLRKAKGYSLKDLEDASGVTASYIHRIETGSRKTPSIPVAEKLAIGLGVNPEEFLKKLNLSNTKTEKKEMLTGFAETIAINSFTINGKKVTKDQKEQIINLFNSIINATWNEETKLQEGMQIINIVDNVKKSLK
ncbi:MAG: helix-turn-helix transcriptional regulator [Oscillospiraceae bacterium]